MGEERLPLIWTRGSWILMAMMRRGGMKGEGGREVERGFMRI